MTARRWYGLNAPREEDYLGKPGCYRRMGGKEGVTFGCLRPGDMLHVLLDKQRDEKNLRDCYKRILLGRSFQKLTYEPGETSPHV